MNRQLRIYVYPNTPALHQQYSNDYIRRLVKELRESRYVINAPTDKGLLNILWNIRRYDVFYFNWIEDLPERRFGILQLPVLILIMTIARLTKKKIVWFIHNNISHSKNRLWLKKIIASLMSAYADAILSHSETIKMNVPKHKFHAFDHPVGEFRPLKHASGIEFDFLIWGTVSRYKGLTEFVEFVNDSPLFKQKKIVIAGKFQSDSYFEEINRIRPKNVTIINQYLTEDELVQLFSNSRYILFAYNSPSVISSAALSKTIAYGKEIIGPEIGSFSDLGRKRLIYTYKSFRDLESLVAKLSEGRIAKVDEASLNRYVASVSWKNFIGFINNIVRKNLNTNIA